MKISAILSLFLLSIAQARADSPIQLQHAASPDATIDIRNVKGSVDIIGWDRAQVLVGGTLGEGARPLQITGTDANLAIHVEAQSGSGWFSWGSDTSMGASNLQVRVPKGASVKVDVVSAPIGIHGLAGGTIELNSVSGKIHVSADTPDLDVNNVSGSIDLSGKARSAKLQTVSGDIQATELGDQAELQTVSGRLHVHGGPWQRLNASTVSGDVEVAGQLANDGSVNINSMSGDVELELPVATSATIHASSFSGDLTSDVGEPRKSEHGPGSLLETRIGTGNGKISVETFSGDLRIRHDN